MMVPIEDVYAQIREFAANAHNEGGFISGCYTPPKMYPPEEQQS
ncbi:hypothetical protein [Bifidobacterium reuteri]|nr:hypothetical protein [Bifidobacterium reuteri]